MIHPHNPLDEIWPDRDSHLTPRGQMLAAIGVLTLIVIALYTLVLVLA